MRVRDLVELLSECEQEAAIFVDGFKLLDSVFIQRSLVNRQEIILASVSEANDLRDDLKMKEVTSCQA